MPSSLNPLRGRLLVQAAITVLLALMGRSAASGWTVPTIVVGVGCVFVALAMRPEPLWRVVVTGYVGGTVAYGLLALVSGHYVPGTVVGAYTLFALVQHGASSFAGPPVWTGPALPSPATPTFAAAAPSFEPMGYAPPQPTSYAPPVVHAPLTAPSAAPAPPLAAPEVYPATPAAPVAVVAPPVPAQPRALPLAMTVLPGK